MLSYKTLLVGQLIFFIMVSVFQKNYFPGKKGNKDLFSNYDGYNVYTKNFFIGNGIHISFLKQICVIAF